MRDCPRKGQLTLEPTCFYLPPLYTTGLRSVVPLHFSCSLARVQIRRASRAVESGDWPPPTLDDISWLGHGDLTNVDCRHAAYAKSPTFRNVGFCEGLRMPAHEGGAARTGAGVRKPPMEETAGGMARWRVRRCGDLAVVSASTTFAIWHELCERVKTPFAVPVIPRS
jgi:hypothetical protein